MVTQLRQSINNENNSRQPAGARRYDVDSLKPEIVNYISRFLPLKKQGRLYVACCPCHDENTASFKVDPDKQTWRCYGSCATGGDVIKFMEWYHGLSFIEVLHELAGRSNTPRAPRKATRLEPAPSVDEPPNETWQHAANNEVIHANHFLLNTNHPEALAARAYLHRRGITDAMIGKYLIGYNPNWKSIDIQDAEGNTISLAPGITIPVRAFGQLWGIKIRRRVDKFAEALNHAPDRHKDGSEVDKYTWLRGSRTGIPFGADGLEAGKDVLVVEGEFDAIVMQAAVTTVAVITAGSASTSIKPHFIERLKGAGKIYTLFDNDAAGRNAKPLEQLQALGSKSLILPEGVKDPTEYWQQGGDLATWYAAATHIPQVWWGENMPDAVDRILLMRYKEAPDQYTKTAVKTVRIMNTLFNQGRLNIDLFTIPEAIEAASALMNKDMRSTLTRGINEGMSLFFSKVDGIEACIPPNFEKKSKGRRCITLKALPKAIVIKNLLTIASRCLKEKHLGDKILARLEAELLAPLVGTDRAAQIAQDVINITAPARERQSWQIKQAYERFSGELSELAADLESPTPLNLEKEWETVDYRAARVRAFVRQSGGKPIPRKQLARVAGCSISHLPKVMEFAGIESTPNQDAEFEVKSTHELTKEIRRINFQHQCKVMNLTVKDGDRIVEWKPLTHATSAWVQSQQQQGRKVYARATTGNTYRIVRDEPVAITPKPKVQREPVPHFFSPSPRGPRVNLPQHDYLQGHDPRWVFNQLVLAVELVTGYQRRSVEGDLTMVDPQTGESVWIESPETLLTLLWSSQDDLHAQARIDRNLTELLEVMG